jgi:hypothetical protein
MTKLRSVVLTLLVFTCGFVVGELYDGSGSTANAQSPKVFELRTYTSPDGKLPNLLARFRDHTLEIFERHGMTNVGYWVPQDAPAASNTLIYILEHDSRDAATKSWDAFRNDPEWKRIAAETQVDGPIVSKVESVFMEATGFSPMK